MQGGPGVRGAQIAPALSGLHGEGAVRDLHGRLPPGEEPVLSLDRRVAAKHPLVRAPLGGVREAEPRHRRRDRVEDCSDLLRLPSKVDAVVIEEGPGAPRIRRLAQIVLGDRP